MGDLIRVWVRFSHNRAFGAIAATAIRRDCARWPHHGRNGLASKCGDDKDAIARIYAKPMASLDSVSIAILLGAVLVMAGILSSLLALRFGAPLLLVFLLIGVMAGESGPGKLPLEHLRTPFLGGAGG